jgi:site-specific recombinase XerD
LVRPISDWPDLDRKLWEAGQILQDQFDGPLYAARLKPISIRNAARSYGRWLVVLDASGEFDPAVMPAVRVTPARVRAFLAALRAQKNSNNSIVTRFFDLQAAFRIMQPEVDFSWLTSHGGVSLRSLLPAERKPIETVDSGELKALGHELMRDALSQKHPEKRCLRYRNGLLIAILASLAPRLRSVAAMTCGQHVLVHGDGYRLVFKRRDVKNKRWIEYPIPPDLVSCARRYLEVERVELLGGKQHDWFWVNREGNKLQDIGIAGMVRRMAKARFGMVFGPHRFRHSLATTAARADPDNPGLAAAVLAVTPGVVGEHYNLAKQEHAAADFIKVVQDERRRTRDVAKQFFRLTK